MFLRLLYTAFVQFTTHYFTCFEGEVRMCHQHQINIKSKMQFLFFWEYTKLAIKILNIGNGGTKRQIQLSNVVLC